MDAAFTAEYTGPSPLWGRSTNGPPSPLWGRSTGTSPALVLLREQEKRALKKQSLEKGRPVEVTLSSDSGSETEMPFDVSDSTGSSCTSRTTDLQAQLQAAEAGLLTAKLQIQNLEDKLSFETSAEKMRSKKSHLITGLKKKKNRRSRERLMVAPGFKARNDARGTELTKRVDEANAQNAKEALGVAVDTAAYQHLMDGQISQPCRPGRWIFNLLSKLSIGNLCDVRAPRPAPRPPGEWMEGDEIEYLAVDVVKGEKQMSWVRARVVAVRSRMVRDAVRRELRVTYYTNKHHQETTYWMVPSDLRLRVPR